MNALNNDLKNTSKASETGSPMKLIATPLDFRLAYEKQAMKEIAEKAAKEKAEHEAAMEELDNYFQESAIRLSTNEARRKEVGMMLV